MQPRSMASSLLGLLLLSCFSVLVTSDIVLTANKEHERHFTWHVTYGTAAPLGVQQRVIKINGQFPGPNIDCVTNDVLVINVFNHLDEPLLFSWNGIHQRHDSWQDGMPGTNCPIMPGTNYKYRFQVKDQIGTFFYYPSLGTQRAAGGFGALHVSNHPSVPVPYQTPDGEYTVLVGDWYNKNHDVLAKTLEQGKGLGHPNGVLINGMAQKLRVLPSRGKEQHPLFTMETRKTYKYHICNVGLNSTISISFQGHTMKLVEMDGTHTVQNSYDYLHVPVGRCFAVLVKADQRPGDYFMVASAHFSTSTSFLNSDIMTVAMVHYVGSNRPPVPKFSPVPSDTLSFFMQLLSLRQNLTASAARVQPQGSYHYGDIKIDRTIHLASHKSYVHHRLRYGFNGVSHTDASTPLKLAQYFNRTSGVFKYNIMHTSSPSSHTPMVITPNVITVEYRSFLEIIFENLEDEPQTFHLNGYSFFPVGMGNSTWTPASRSSYNKVDAVYTHTVQVFPKSWTAVLVSFDNAGMWNLRSESLEKRYLGLQLYISVVSPVHSVKDKYEIPENVLLCGSIASKDGNKNSSHSHPDYGKDKPSHNTPNAKAAPKDENFRSSPAAAPGKQEPQRNDTQPKAAPKDKKCCSSSMPSDDKDKPPHQVPLPKSVPKPNLPHPPVAQPARNNGGRQRGWSNIKVALVALVCVLSFSLVCVVIWFTKTLVAYSGSFS